MERRQLATDTNVEALRQELKHEIKEEADGVKREIEEGYKLMAQYSDLTEKQLDERFGKIEKRLDVIEVNMATKEDLSALETRFRATFATKEDLNALETRILGAFQQVVTLMSHQQPLR